MPAELASEAGSFGNSALISLKSASWRDRAEEIGALRQRQRLVQVEAEAVHAGIDVDR
jgi:hypothetical protein